VDDLIFARTKSSGLRIPRPKIAAGSSVGGAWTASNARAKAPNLLLPPTRSFVGWWDSFLLIFARGNPSSSRRPVYLFRHGTVARPQMPGKPLAASFALHCFPLLLLIYVHQAIPADASALANVKTSYEKIYYPLPLLNSPKVLPRIAPTGPGALPGDGAIQELVPALGSTVRQDYLSAVSNPAHPDNFRQTIYQRSSPPDLRIKTEIKLPNVILGAPSELPKMPMNPNDAKPARSSREITSGAAPVPSLKSPSPDVVTFLQPSNVQPHLAIPTVAASKPVRNSEVGGSAGSGDADRKSIGDGADLLVLGVDPAGASTDVSLPAGNRWGNFSISPVGGVPGSAGGVNYGIEAGGKGGIGAGGDESTGVGPGGGGGGGGKSAPPGAVSVKGTESKNGAGGSLGSGLAMSMVYPVPSSFTPRRNSLIVAVGPMGGGGLDAYGALHCGKIYSIFLAMPGKSWAMQYCLKPDAAEKSATELRATVIHLDRGLVPPDVEARFDFRRLTLPPEKAHKMIVLKGTLKDDGIPENLEVYQGILPEMDEAARAAFSQWRFKPAMRDGKPVPVEILIGIPTEDPTQ
jgi:TonB-like protein